MAFPELWIFILASGEIEVHRQPTPEGYADVQRYRRGDTLTIEDPCPMSGLRWMICYNSENADVKVPRCCWTIWLE